MKYMGLMKRKPQISTEKLDGTILEVLRSSIVEWMPEKDVVENVRAIHYDTKNDVNTVKKNRVVQRLRKMIRDEKVEVNLLTGAYKVPDWEAPEPETPQATPQETPHEEDGDADE